MKRREFIRLGGFLTVSAAAIGMTGCDIVGDSSDTSAQPLDPASYPNPTRDPVALSTGGAWSFPQSVASGDPRSDSIILWTRVLNDAAPVDPTAPMTVDAGITLTLVAAADFTGSLDSSVEITDTPAATVQVSAYADFDGTVRHKFTGLDPDTVYYYQFKAGTVCSRVGRCKTAPAAASSRTVKFAYMSCQDWSANHWGAFTHIVEQDVATPADLDFVVHLGDYIYETDNGGAASNEALHAAIVLPDGTSIPPAKAGDPAPGGAYATTKADYRYLYKLYRSDARIQRMHERFPMVAVWDDHEFSDDSWQNFETYQNKNSAQLDRRRSATQAWFEFMPADVAFQELNPSYQNIQLYRDLKFGSVLHLVMTDQRLFRQDHLIPETSLSPTSGQEIGRINARYLVPEDKLKFAEMAKDAAAPNLSLISILGSTQRSWWKSTMSASDTTWRVWGNEVSLLRMSLNGTNAIATLLSLSFIQPVATAIGTAAADMTLFPGSMTQSACYIGATRFGAAAGNGNAAYNATGAMNTAFLTAVGGGLNPANPADQATIIGQMVAAGMGQGITLAQAQVGAIAYLAVVGSIAAGGNTTAQATAGAQAICVGSASSYFSVSDTYPSIRNDIRTNGTSSAFYGPALGNNPATMLAVAAFFRKFVINGDQWDGYRKERTELMNYLIDQNIGNVVAVTGDLHANFAGVAYNEFQGEVLTINPSAPNNLELTAADGSASTAAMVDLVCAGVSSTSWFSYIKAAADVLDPSNSLIGKLVYVPIPISVPADQFYPGSPAVSFTASLNLLDYTLGKPLLGADDTARATNLAAQLNQQIKRALAAGGVAEGALDPGATGVQAQVAEAPTFASALGLAKMLSALGVATNPWLSAGMVDTEAQGYAVVEASTTDLKCHFRKLNPIVGTAAPSSARLVVSTRTATVTDGVKAVVVS